MEKIIINKMPFVDGIPQYGQKRIEWLLNGEDLDGGEHEWDSSGPLNRTSLAIQKNVETLAQNDVVIGDYIDATTARLDVIEQTLGESSNIPLLELVAKHDVDIKANKDSIDSLTTKLDESDLDVMAIKDDIGVYDPTKDSVYRPIRGDLTWIKEEIGQFDNEDINGETVPGNESTGLKRRILTNTQAYNTQASKILAIETTLAINNVSDLNQEVTNLKENLGNPEDESFKPSAFGRIKKLEESKVQTDSEINAIKAAIDVGGGTIADKFTEIESDQSAIELTLNDPTTGVVVRLASAETKIADNKSEIDTNKIKLDSVDSTLGTTATTGVRGEVKVLNDKVGIGNETGAGTIIKGLSDVTAKANANGTSIQNLTAEIGDNQTGIKSQVLRLNRVVDGTNPAGTTVAEKGLIAVVTAHDATIQTLIPEAPKDGKAYVRKDGAWVDLATFLTP